MVATLPVVQMFWHGSPLSRIEQLSMASFVAAGHTVRLHVYDEPANVPPGVQLVDARAVLPRDVVFRHDLTGSYSQFSDWFRYRVLHRHGGIYADTDVICLAPLDYSQQELFAWQDDRRINGAVLGLPAGHVLAAWMAGVCEAPNRVLPYDKFSVRCRKWKRRWLQGNRRGNVRWAELGPGGFTRAARHFGYAGVALPAHHFYPVPVSDWRRVFDGVEHPWETALAGARAVHLWNEMMRRAPGFDKDAAFPPTSLFERLWRRHLGVARQQPV